MKDRKGQEIKSILIDLFQNGIVSGHDGPRGRIIKIVSK